MEIYNDITKIKKTFLGGWGWGWGWGGAYLAFYFFNFGEGGWDGRERGWGLSLILSDENLSCSPKLNNTFSGVGALTCISDNGSDLAFIKLVFTQKVAEIPFLLEYIKTILQSSEVNIHDDTKPLHEKMINYS